MIYEMQKCALYIYIYICLELISRILLYDFLIFSGLAVFHKIILPKCKNIGKHRFTYFSKQCNVIGRHNFYKQLNILNI